MAGSSDVEQILTEHVRRALISDLGVRHVECWLGKSGPAIRSVDELATVVVGSLAAVLDDEHVASLVASMHAEGELAPPLAIDPNDW